MRLDYSLIGKRLSYWRKKKHLTQHALAKAAGLSTTFISHVETCRSIPSLETVMAICYALDISPNELLLGSFTNDRQYMLPEIQQKLESCTPQERRLVMGFIDLLLMEKDRE